MLSLENTIALIPTYKYEKLDNIKWNYFNVITWPNHYDQNNKK